MPNLGIEIKRKCEICGNIFVIKTLDSIYCSPKCSKIASKRKKDKEKKEALFAAYAQTVPDILEYLTAKQVVAIYGIERSTLYRLVRLGKIPSISLGVRLTRFKRSEMDKLFHYRRDLKFAKEVTKKKLYSLEAQQNSNKEDILRQIKFLNQTLNEIRINLREKQGKLDQVNQELDSLKSTYNAKLKGLDAIMKKDNVMINCINKDAEIILKVSIFDQVLYEAVKICWEIPEADAMAEDTFIDDRNNFRWKDVLSTGLRVFIVGIDGATGVAQVSGGGGTSNDMPWRDKDEDFLHWAWRAMQYAHAKHYPGNKLRKSKGY